MKAHRLIANARPLVALLAFVSSVQAASTDLATVPLSGASAIQIFPNILFVLDDSGSMDWDYLPDWADPAKDINKNLPIREVRSRNAAFNGIAYNPAVTYNPPSYFDTNGVADTAKYPSQTKDRFSVSYNGYGYDPDPEKAQRKNIRENLSLFCNEESGKCNLQRAAYYYTTVPGEYCTDGTLRLCQKERGGSYQTPAYLRWCNTPEAAALATSPEVGACRATQIDKRFDYPRMPEPQTSQLTITAAGSVSSIQVDGKEILRAAIAWQQDPVALARSIADEINACSFGLTGNCQVIGYRATLKDQVVSITAPAAFTDMAPVLTQNGSITAGKFGRWGANLAPGDVRLTVITDSVATYDKVATRTDCLGVKCSYDEEMTNFANWWAYYRTRMQAMKTASSQSFAKIDKTRRVGYLSINNNTGSDFLNIGEFTGAQKKSWYDALFAAIPNKDTPLREALAKAGWLYAGKYNQSTLNGVAVTDPVQYYCQKNATILSTDGYWTEGKNGEGKGFKLDGQDVGDQDSAAAPWTPAVVRPQLDGGGQQETQTLSQILMTTTPAANSLLERKTEQVVAKYYPRTKSTRTDPQSTSSVSTWQYYDRYTTEQTAKLEQQTQYFTKTVTQVQKQSRLTGQDGWGEWENTDTECIEQTNDTNCRALTPTDTPNLTQCTPNEGYYGTNKKWKTDVQCTLTGNSWLSANQCSDPSKCRYVGFTNDPKFPDCATTDTLTRKNLDTFPASTVSRTCKGAATDWADIADCQAGTYDGYIRVCQKTDSVWVHDEGCAGVADGTNKPNDPSRICGLGWTGYVETDQCSIEENKTRCSLGEPTLPQPVQKCNYTDDGEHAVVTCPPPTLVSDWTADDKRTDKCQEGISTDANGVITSIRCSTPAATWAYVAKCETPEQIADEKSHFIITDCKTEIVGPTDVEICTKQEAQDCPTQNANKCWTTTCGSRARGATDNTLADVAQYYYLTDLRTPDLKNCPGDTGGVCGPKGGVDEVQRMLTYTLGLGALGRMQYTDDYVKTANQEGDVSDYGSIKRGTAANPDSGICSWQPVGTPCNWPAPASDSQTNIDDLWHAAVNGRGTYYSARDPSALAAGISSALADIGTAKGSLAAVTVTSPNLVSGDNAVYEVSFEVGVWAGDVAKRKVTVDGSTVVISADVVWSAEAQLRKKAVADRKIYTFDSNGQPLKPFTWGQLSEKQQSYLSKDYIKDNPLPPLSQFCDNGVTCLKADDQDKASGENLLNFLRGDGTYEGDVDNLATFYRQRSTKGSQDHRPLGDISGSEAVYVKLPPWNYVDTLYAEFRKAQAEKDRKAMVYVGANDGMLHAFEADTGDEAWAYVPALVFPKLYQLADKEYPGKHQFTVDGTPVMGDICASNCQDSGAVWKTILVGGLNLGGRGYYALDVTDPAAPKALWEFSHANLGYTYGNPVISELKDGTWVVIVASGYNNGSDDGGGDGKGHLFLLNANTGALLRTIDTSAGDTTTPSGLARITAWANFPDVNNTAERVYGGDLLGNLWRFDINNDIPPDGYDAHPLATLKDANGDPQAITTRPELGKVKNYPVVFVGTGKLLGTKDFEKPFQQQSFYAIKDKLDSSEYGNPRSTQVTNQEGQSSNAFTAWTIGTGECPAGVFFCKKGDPVSVVTDLLRKEGETDEQYAERLAQTQHAAISNAMGPYNDGWYIDFATAGEQSNTDPSLQRGSIVFTTNRPLEGGACEPKATSSRYFLDYRTGSAIEGTNGIIGVKIADSLATRAAVVVLPNDQLWGLTRTDKPGIEPAQIPIPPPSEAARRISWRELVTE